MSLAAPQRLTPRRSFHVPEEDLAEMGLPGPMRLALPTNTLVVAGTSGFHARSPAVGLSRRTEI